MPFRPGSQQAPHLLDQPGCEHGPDAGLDARLELRPRPVQLHQPRRPSREGRRLARERRGQFRQRAARRQAPLQRARHAPRIAHVERAQSRRVQPPQFRHQRRQALAAPAGPPTAARTAGGTSTSSATGAKNAFR